MGVRSKEITMANFNEIFTANVVGMNTTSTSRSLQGTAQLTDASTTAAGTAMSFLQDNCETYSDRIELSKTSHTALDELISELVNLEAIDVSFLRELPDTTLDAMLKSQQSKRSRTKGKEFTLDNYKTMMVAAIAEALLRQVMHKAKSAGRKASAGVEYTVDQIGEFAADIEMLKKELRNVQSKKSIMKSKEGFSEEDERWIKLCEAEYLLKSMRSQGATIKVDETKNKITALVAGIDVEKLKPAEAKALLLKAMDLLSDVKEDVAAETDLAKTPDPTTSNEEPTAAE